MIEEVDDGFREGHLRREFAVRLVTQQMCDGDNVCALFRCDGCCSVFGESLESLHERLFDFAAVRFHGVVANAEMLHPELEEFFHGDRFVVVDGELFRAQERAEHREDDEVVSVVNILRFFVFVGVSGRVVFAVRFQAEILEQVFPEFHPLRVFLVGGA